MRTLFRWLATALLLLHGLARAGELRVEVLDVGQGDGILITSPAGKRVLIDASIKSADVVGQLRARGVQSLDLVVATHPHADHIGGMKDVVEAFPIRLYTDNGLPHTTATYTELMAAIEAKQIPYRGAKAGQSFSLDDGIKIEVLNPREPPLSGTRSDLNANSVVLRLQHGQNCFLFTGDAEEPTEQELLRGGLASCGVLKVAHHGSNHSSTDAFLRTVKPELALISVGVANRYKHPGEETLARLGSAGARVFRTDLDGEIRVLSDGRSLRVETGGKSNAAAAVALARQQPPMERERPVSAAMTTGSVPHAGGPSGGGATTSAAPTSTAAAASSAATGALTTEAVEPSRRELRRRAREERKAAAWRAGAMAPEAEAPPPVAAPAPAPPSSAPPAPVTAGSTSPQPGEPGCLFVSTKGSNLYHPGDCHIARRIWEGNRICWASEAEAQAAGKTRSSACPSGSGANP